MTNDDIVPLTWRQTEVLLGIYIRFEKNGFVTIGNLITDLGLSITTIGNHLKNLDEKKLLLQPETKKIKYSGYDRHLLLTQKGIKNAEYKMSLINASKTDPITTIYEKNLNYCENIPSSSHLLHCYKTTPSPFSKAFNDILENNPLEPFTVSTAMYSELDGQLALLAQANDERYMKLSLNNLHMQIRNGRISSIAIPISLRGSISQKDLNGILGTSWSWPGITKGHSSAQRYLKEVLSLGIAQKQGDKLVSMNATTTDTITWLANKVNSAFQNVITPKPKISLLAYRETFKYPTIEDLLNPQNSDMELDWLNTIRDYTDSKAYTNTIENGIDILLNQANIIELRGDRLVPRTVLRKIKKLPQIEKKFDFFMDRATEGNIAAIILLTITAKPGITLTELYSEINNKTRSSPQEIDLTLNTLSQAGLIYPSHAKASEVKYYAITHIPYLMDDSKESLKANAIFKNLQPDTLSKIDSMFPDIEEKKILYEVINKIITNKSIDLEYLDQYGSTFKTKMTILSTSINPFLKPDDSYSRLVLEDSSVSNIILNVVQYSLKANIKSIGIYSDTLIDMVRRDCNYYQNVKPAAEELKTEIFDEELKSNSI